MYEYAYEQFGVLYRCCKVVGTPGECFGGDGDGGADGEETTEAETGTETAAGSDDEEGSGDEIEDADATAGDGKLHVTIQDPSSSVGGSSSTAALLPGATPDAGSDTELIYPEFLEALAAIACFRIPDPYRSCASRLQYFLEQDFLPFVSGHHTTQHATMQHNTAHLMPDTTRDIAACDTPTHETRGTQPLCIMTKLMFVVYVCVGEIEWHLDIGWRMHMPRPLVCSSNCCHASGYRWHHPRHRTGCWHASHAS